MDNLRLRTKRSKIEKMKKQKTFLTYEKPLLTAMAQAEAPQECKDIILNSLWDGAEALAGECRACMRLQ